MEELISFIQEAKAPHLLVRHPILSSLDLGQFSEAVLPALLKIARRSAKTLPMVSAVIRRVRLDLSEISPNFLEFSGLTLDEENAVNAETLFAELIKKSPNQGPLVEHFLGKSAGNEKVIMMLLKTLRHLSADPAIMAFCFRLMPRVKSEEGQLLLLECLEKYELNDQLNTYYTKNIGSIAHANRFSRFSPNVPLKYPTNPQQLLAALSLQIPAEQASHVDKYLNSDLNIPKMDHEAALAIARVTYWGLQRWPDRQGLYEALTNWLLGKHKAPRTFLFENVPPLNIELFEITLFEALKSEEKLERFLSNFKQIVTKFGGAGLLRTVCHYGGDKQQLWFQKKYKNDLPQSFFGDWKVDSFLCLNISVNEFFIQFQKYLLVEPYIEICKIESDLETIFDLSHIDFDPLIATCKQFLDYDLHALDEEKIFKVLNARTKEKIRAVMGKVKAYLFAQTYEFFDTICEGARKLHKFHADKSAFYEHIFMAILPAILGLYEVDALKEKVATTSRTVFKYSNYFGPIASVMTEAVLSHVARNFKEGVIETAIISVNIEKLTIGEASIFLKLVTWTLLDGLLPETSLLCLADIINYKKFSSINPLLTLAVKIMQLGLQIHTLSDPLFPLLDTDQFSLLFNTVLHLPMGQKLEFLELVLNYEGTIPNDEAIATQVWVCRFDPKLSEVATGIWEKFEFRLTKNVICEELPDYLFADSDWIRTHSGTGLVQAILETPSLRAVLLYAVMQKKRGSKFVDGFITFYKNLPDLEEQEADEIIGFIIEIANFKDKDLINLGLHVLQLFKESEMILYSIQSTIHTGNESIALIYMAYLAQFLPETHGSIDEIIYNLIDALEANKEGLFEPILASLPQLLMKREFMREELAIDLQDKLMSEPSRGVAYAIGGLFKAGLSFDKIDQLWSVLYSKKPTVQEKLAILLVIEGISVAIGSDVDSYLKEFVPFILECFAVPDLTDQSGKTLLQLTRQLDANSIKLMIELLKFDSVNWKTKVGSLQAIGNLALGAPKQFLKDIVPEVVSSFSDTHKNVLQEAKNAISKIGKVITNPEIAKIVRQINIALGDATKVQGVLTLLSKTKFRNMIDAASLSLIMPIIEKGLKNKNIEIKLVACKAIESISEFTAPLDMQLYFDRLLPCYGSSLFDSIPEVRDVAADTLGLVAKYLGADNSSEVVDWLDNMLQSECSVIERAGASYAYSKIIPYINWDLHRFLGMCQSEEVYVRESYLELLSYLPTHTSFLENFNEICAIMYENISHVNNAVREASVKVMNRSIKHYSKTHLDMIIQPLEDGLFSENWRTRQSSLSLMGLLLETLQKRDRREGTTSLEDDKKHRILATIYLLRSDRTSNISVIAAQTWNKIVDNTQKLMPVMTPILVNKVLDVVEQDQQDTIDVIICSFEGILNNYQEAAARNWLPHIIELKDQFPCGTLLIVGMIVDKISGLHLGRFLDEFTTLLDFLLRLETEELRDRAGKIFIQYYNKTSNEHISSEGAPIILNLFEMLEDSPVSFRQMVRWSSKNITRNVMFRVMRFGDSKYEIMAQIAGIIGEDILAEADLRYLFPKMLEELGNGMIDAVCELGASLTKHDSVSYFLETVERIDEVYILPILKHFCKHSKFNFSIYINYLLDIVIGFMDHPNTTITAHIPETVSALIKPMPKEEQHTIMPRIANVVDHEVALFQVVKGVECLLPILQNSLFHGPPDTREMAAKSYRNILTHTEPKFIEKFVVNMAGPLIRVVGERVPTDLKVQAHKALFLLMQKGKAKMKVFTAQLLSTFTKAFQQTDPTIQEVGRENLLELLSLGPKVELLISDLGKSSTPEGLALLEEVLQRIKVTDNDRKSALTKILNSNAVFKKDVAVLLYPNVMDIPYGPESIPLIYELLPSYPDLRQVLVKFNLEGVEINYETLNEILGPQITDFFTEMFEAISWDIYKYMENLEKIPPRYVTEANVKLILPALAEAFAETEEVDDVLAIVLKLDTGPMFAERCLDVLEGDQLEDIAKFIDDYEQD